MSLYSFRKGLCLIRSIQRKIVHLKSTATSYNAECSQTVGSAAEKNIRPMDKLEQHQFKKNYSEKKMRIKSRSNTDSAMSSFICSNKNNPDTFGTLSEDWKMHEQLKGMPDEEDDVVETEFLFNKEGKTKLTITQYARIIKTFIKQNKIGLALDVLETRMLKIDKRKPPDSYIYNLLIGACGRVGYTKKAFKLYKQIKERGLEVTGHAYTGLFNACANSPYPEDALKRAKHLQGIMLEKGVLMNSTIYHAMIKAFGRCGDLETTFMLVDEMLEKKILVSEETFNFLLQACITDKTSGFRHALLVWRKMKEKRIWPNLYSFNLLLRASRDCGLGDEVATQQVVQLLLLSGQNKTQRLTTGADCEDKSETQVSLSAPPETDNLPNLIAQEPTMGNVLSLTSVTQPEHRLMLMGGSKGILDEMRRSRVKPDIKTFTQLLDQLPSCLNDEEELMVAVKEANVPLDVDFCNMLIRKRCFRKDYKSALDVLKVIYAEKFRPTIMTFGVLAMACQDISSAKQLLKDINEIGYRPNIEILGTLLKNACYTRNCDFVLEIMNTLEEEEIKPNEMFIKHVDNFYNFITNKPNKASGYTWKQERFLKYYQDWRQTVQPDALSHPWAQFQEPHLDPQDEELMNTGREKYVKL